MLESVACRRVRVSEGRMEEGYLEKKPKLSVLRKIVKCDEVSSCADLKCGRGIERRVMLKLRGGTASFQVEIVRWQGMIEERMWCARSVATVECRM